MIPIVTPAEMAAIDAAAPEPVDVLIERAGAAVAWSARRLLGGTYGRRVVVLAGKGNNGADGRVAAARLARWGCRVTVVDAALAPATLPPADLVIDAAYGTGLQRPYHPPAVGDAPVLAVDIPSGVDGLTGALPGDALTSVVTVTFAALKPGLVLPPGRWRAGRVEVADIGLPVGSVAAHLVTAADVAAWLPARPAAAHKWRHAVWVIGGAPGMTGAADLAALGALRAGASYVRLSTPGGAPSGAVREAVGFPLTADGWDLSEVGRFAAVVVGPGLGRSPATLAQVTGLLARTDRPAVVDGDALYTSLPARSAPTLLTPHDREYEALVGQAPGPDRLAAARHAAATLGATVLLKGPATVVADPAGAVLVADTGDQRLATAGSGDVLAGIAAALLAGGLDPLRAGAVAAWLHGRAAALGPVRGLVAGDLPDLLPAAMP